MVLGKIKLLICSVWLTAGVATAQMGQVGDAVPNFTLVGLDDSSYTLSDYSGKAILLFLLTPF